MPSAPHYSQAEPLFERDIDTAPVGLYAILHNDGTPIEEVRDYLDITQDHVWTNVRCRLLCRIDAPAEGQVLPQGVASAGYRPDGYRVIKAWEPAGR